MESVPIITNIEVYSIQHYVIKFQWLTAGRWFSPGASVSSTNKTDRHDITEILLKVALNIINQPNQPSLKCKNYLIEEEKYNSLSSRLKINQFIPDKAFLFNFENIYNPLITMCEYPSSKSIIYYTYILIDVHVAERVLLLRLPKLNLISSA
jgi:hypothetical protein